MQGGGTGGLAFFDTIYKAATLPESWTAPQRELQPSTTASPRPLPNQGGLVATVSDLHHEQHTARPELYAPKVMPARCYFFCFTVQRDISECDNTLTSCVQSGQVCTKLSQLWACM